MELNCTRRQLLKANLKREKLEIAGLGGRVAIKPHMQRTELLEAELDGAELGLALRVTSD